MDIRKASWALALSGTLFVGCSRMKKSDMELRATADEAMRRGEYSRVIALDTELARRDPGDFHATLQRGIALDRLGRNSEALSDFGRAIELDSTAALPRLYRANISMRLGQSGAARQDVQALMSMQLRPSDRIAASTLAGTVEQLSGNFMGAIAHYNRAIDQGRSDTDQHSQKHYRDALQNAAECHYRLGDFGGAIGRMNESVEAKRRAGVAITEDDNYTLGVLHYMAGNFEDSKRHFAKVSQGRRASAATALNDPGFFENL